MKLLHFWNGGGLCIGWKTEDAVYNLSGFAAKEGLPFPVSLDLLIRSGSEGTEQLAAVLRAMNVKDKQSNFRVDEDEIEFASVVLNPEKILCVGLNYLTHALESNMAIPDSPVLFSKFNNALAGHKQDIVLPQSAQQVDYEAELVIVIGKEARNVSEEDALSYVYGYSAGNDVSARDLQLKTSQWLLGKTLDSFAPIGPYLVTGDELDPAGLAIECRVNGELRQSSNTKNMIFGCRTLISYISRYMTLKPGDVIFTGTPEGVVLGYPPDRQTWLKAGDEMEVMIEGIGRLKNKLV
ncbi:fumarylacetoacetate hydrolase family protein [Paenibacillus macerans]|uniref:fumarylacetoacetate hydrolase family protein n=1 Tax=Paenibacillus macerans TaxID=44252 RepID=UPI00203E9052|nr:fumarylacetoacetate hydrolase family protein [Paenibacillus macerans]MCM3697997.1 fumarylacetoacetate hydrolase family protein [Paenibacillus macerans]